MSLTYSVRYMPESDPFKRPRIPTYVKPSPRPKFSAEELENALSSLQSVVDNIKTVLERFDEDLGRLKDRSRQLDREILHEQTRMWDYKRRRVEAQSASGNDSWPRREQLESSKEDCDGGMETRRRQVRRPVKGLGGEAGTTIPHAKRRELSSEDVDSTQENKGKDPR
ncbi:hypothetical protein FRC00_004926 [Tulasnella sp. 408]|nr:hypothetical protein FRC00_004926 [Tulasnella sp. 408]